jgi:hypothetical protein
MLSVSQLACCGGLLLLGCLEGSGPYPEGDVRQQALEKPSCTQECPAGTRIATFATDERTLALDTFGGAFVYAKAGCETYCEPLMKCLAPNVPVVTAEDYECQLLPRYDSFPAAADVDLSFGALWDESRVTP